MLLSQTIQTNKLHFFVTTGIEIAHFKFYMDYEKHYILWYE